VKNKYNRMYKCKVCNSKQEHYQESQLWIYSCLECGEFKTTPKLRKALNLK